MPVPAYIPIPDSDIDQESPINEYLLQRLRDNILAVIGGGVGAPSLSSGLLGVGGSIADGLLDDTWAPASPGYYDFEGSGPSVLSTGRTWPWFVGARVLGNLAISASMRIDGTPILSKYHVTDLAVGVPHVDVLSWNWTSPAKQFGVVGASGDVDRIQGTGTISITDTGGGACVGDGIDPSANGVGGVGIGAAAALRRWAKPIPIFGGPGNIDVVGGTYNKGGGCLVLIVDGDLDMTGGTLDASGYGASEGGAGGSVFVFCTGTLTNGTFKANGAPGGGGGYVAVVANAYAGVQTLQATAGAGAGAGLTEKITLTANYIRGLLWRP